MSESGGDGGKYRQWRFQLPPGATDLIIVRHGESMPASFDQPAPTLDGQADPDLAPEGVEQAQRIADRLAIAEISAIYVTPLRRTSQTAAPLAARLGLEPEVVPELREVFLGDWEGAAFRKHTLEVHPLVVEMFDKQRWDVIPGAESTDEFRDRVRRGVKQVAAAHPDQHVVLVVHGGVIGVMFALASDAGNFAFIGADNGSISQLVVSGDRWLVRRFNDTAHLDPSFTLVPHPLT